MISRNNVRLVLLQKRFEGTRVTVESFLSWKEKFDEEMGYTKRRDLAEREGKKLTGKELFMTDKTLDQSDLQFLDDGKSTEPSLRFCRQCGDLLLAADNLV
jgi:hypothetical protein